MPERHFTQAKILEALQALGDELTRRGVRGQIFIVGGAAMALAYSTRRVTKDIDAVFEPKSAIYAAAATVADELGLPEDWLNDAAKGYMPGPDEHPRPVADIRGIEVTTASPRYLLAMKLMAMRFGEDDEDITILLRECDLHSAQEAIDLLKHVYPLREPPPKTRFFLEELFGSVRSAYVTLVALVVAVLMLARPVAASAVLPAGPSSVDAPGLLAGPVITDAGLAWESSDGIVLTNSAGRSAVLGPPDPPNWDNFVDLTWFGRDWWALARPSGVLAGRIGGPLHELPLLGGCNPGSTSPTPGASEAQYAVSGDHLYAALPHGCLARRARFGEVLAINLRSHRWRVLAPLRGPLDVMAASGRYLALAYRRGPRSTAEQPLLVRVLNAATGALVNQIRPPLNVGGLGPNSASGIQVDDNGDVLVTTGCCGASPGQLAHVAQPLERMGWWWARAGSTVGQEAHLGRDAVLSDGQVAFLSADAGDPESATIDVRNLLTATTRTVVAFSGSVSPTSLALSGSELAWAQQSTVVSVVTGPLPGGGGFEECKDVPLSPVELASLDLRHTPSAPVVVNGAPIPPQYAHEPPCIEA